MLLPASEQGANSPAQQLLVQTIRDVVVHHNQQMLCGEPLLNLQELCTIDYVRLVNESHLNGAELLPTSTSEHVVAQVLQGLIARATRHLVL